MNDKVRTEIMKEAIDLFDKGYKIKKVEEEISKLYPNHPNAIYVAKSAIEMFKSLIIAVDRAGGVGWSIDELCKMSVMDLISCLATNHVKFTYDGK